MAKCPSHCLPALLCLAAVVLAGEPAVAQRASQRLAILEFRGKIETEVLEAFSDAVRGGAVEGLVGREVEVLTRENMLVLLKDMGKSDCAEGECEVETARNLGADFVVSGSVARVDEAFVVTLKLHETKRGSLLASDQVDALRQLEVLRMLREHGRKLVANNIEARRAPEAVTKSPPPVQPSAVPVAAPPVPQPATASTVAPAPPKKAPTSPPAAGVNASQSKKTVAPPTTQESVTRDQPPVEPKGHGLRVASIACGAVGLASIGAGVYFHTSATSYSDKVSNATVWKSSDYDAGKNAEKMQWVFYSVGAGALATGTLLYLLGHSAATSSPPVSLAPILGPGNAGLSAQGAF
jgi:TolB-like protein